MDIVPSESTSSASPAETSRSKISSACLYCKGRKRKCSGGNPCAACKALNIACTYDETLDKRRKFNLEKERTEFVLCKEVLHRLLDVIRSGNDKEVYNAIRSNASIESLATRLSVPVTGRELRDYPSDESRPRSQSLSQSQSWQTSRDASPDDISQREELTKRRKIPLTVENISSITYPETTAKRRGSSPGRSGFSDKPATLGQRAHDPRAPYRLRCHYDCHYLPLSSSVNVFGNIRLHFADRARASSQQNPYQNMASLHVPVYLIQPLLYEEERCPLAAVYTDFRDQGRKRLAEGEPPDLVLGAADVDLELFFRRRRDNDPHTPATWACEYMSLIKDFDIYVSLANIYTYARFMRWTIAPNEETWSLLPEIMRPTMLQKMEPHHPGIDLPLFPEMRDGLIADMRDYIVATQSLGVSVNWPHTLGEAIDLDPITQKKTLSPKFVAHVCNLANWSISRGFADVFPELKGKYHVVDVERLEASKFSMNDILLRQR